MAAPASSSSAVPDVLAMSQLPAVTVSALKFDSAASSSPSQSTAPSSPMTSSTQSVGKVAVRKKGIPWTEEEHRLFLQGLQKHGKGDWRGISWNFVQSRTPTQVASHAQKYFIRQGNSSKRKKRASLFDMAPALPNSDNPFPKKQATAEKSRAVPVEPERPPAKHVAGEMASKAANGPATPQPHSLPLHGLEAGVSAAMHGFSYPGGYPVNPMYIQSLLVGPNAQPISSASGAPFMPWFYAQHQMLPGAGHMAMPSLLPPVSDVVPPMPKKSKAVSDIAVKVHRPVASLPRIITGKHTLPRPLMPLSLSMPLTTTAT